MKNIFGSKNFPKDLSKPVVALGNFDGVHLGHRELIKLTKSEAKKRGGTSVIYTFEPHPVKLLAPSECPPLLQTLDQKLAELEKLNMNACVIEPFTAAFSAQTPAVFFKSVIVDRMHAYAVITGYDFTFGSHRDGNTDTIKKLGKEHGVQTHIVTAKFYGNTLISSTNIRQLVAKGDVREALSLLGRPYSISGRVKSGRGIGQTLAAHTANIESENELIPKDGVYVTRTMDFPSVTSIGTSPTFPGSPFSIETHIIDKQIDLLGQTITIEFLDRLRGQIAFKSADELKKQIKKDIEEAKDRYKLPLLG